MKTGLRRRMGMWQVMSVHPGRHRPEPYSEGYSSDNDDVHSVAVAAAAAAVDGDNTIHRS